MSKTHQSKGYKRFYPALKWLFSLLSLYFFFDQVKSLELDVFTNIWSQLCAYILVSFSIVLLALINWNAEAQKFKLLIAGEARLSDVQAFFTILGGMAISNFTPARTGEYIGRGLLLKKLHPLKVVVATVAGNLAQVIMTYSLGLICIGLAVIYSDFGGEITSISKITYVGAIFLALLAFIWNVKKILPWVKRILPKKIAKTLNLVRRYDRKLYLRVVVLAFLRYAAFSVQFYLLLQLFSGFALPLSAIIFVPIAYLMQSLVPVPAVSDIGVRVAVSQLLFGTFISGYSILQAVTCLWFLNLILPGLLGTVYLLISALRK